ncbi:hypothetical protein N7494_013243 [Penicillium frequentans]|uniref:Uncharacterized protein n=1 Tax=Penicillium frequentans TaxID=3151616 RepID=A0AAD6CI44_9EURO|nr:hypothetical protein N7494_013243 [Penicillium glabrum]
MDCRHLRHVRPREMSKAKTACCAFADTFPVRSSYHEEHSLVERHGVTFRTAAHVCDLRALADGRPGDAL